MCKKYKDKYLFELADGSTTYEPLCECSLELDDIHLLAIRYLPSGHKFIGLARRFKKIKTESFRLFTGDDISGKIRRTEKCEEFFYREVT